MNPAWESYREPSPEQLAAYYDGELSPDQRADVEAWLASHPDGQAELDSLHQFHALYESTSPPEPAATRWEETHDRIEARLFRTRPHSRPRSRNWGWALLAAGVAAAVLAILMLPSVVPVDATPFPVVSAEEVRIISMNPNDRDALVNVRALDLFEIVLADHFDVEIRGGNTEGMMRIDDWASPMIVDPLAYGGPR